MLTLTTTPQSACAVRARAMVFEDPLSRRLLERIERIATGDAPLLITGDTGTGKELVAQRVHELSRRASRPFVAVNVGAFAETLIESELFGHEKGAFTGAHAAKPGFFETAHGGTLFLDEIGELAPALQVKLLRVLQEGQVTRVGARVPRDIDVRLVAATNVDLQAAMRARHFREDLYYRLRVSTLGLPALRDRPGDILPLVAHFLRIYAEKLGRCVPRLSAEAEQCLLQHRWPGNIRELENTIHHALIVCASDELGASDLELGVSTLSRLAPTELASTDELDALSQAFGALIEQRAPDIHARAERLLFSLAYERSGRNQLEAARVLGVSRNVVRARLIEHGCLPGPLRRSTPAPSRVLRIGYQKLGLLMLLKQQGALEASLAQRSVRVHWLEFEGGIQIVEALRAGRLDLAGLGDSPAVMAQAERVPVVYVAAEPPAPRGTALIVPANSPIFEVASLRGRRIAVNRAAQAHHLLARALEEAGVEREAVEICFEPPERALSLFRAGAVDAWAIWDPFLASARLELGARVLRDASGFAANSTYYLASRSFVEESGDLVEEALRQLRKSARWASADREHAAALSAKALGFSPRALVASWQRELDMLPVGSELLSDQQGVADALHRLDLIRQPVSVVDAVWPYRLTG